MICIKTEMEKKKRNYKILPSLFFTAHLFGSTTCKPVQLNLFTALVLVNTETMQMQNCCDLQISGRIYRKSNISIITTKTKWNQTDCLLAQQMEKKWKETSETQQSEHWCNHTSKLEKIVVYTVYTSQQWMCTISERNAGLMLDISLGSLCVPLTSRQQRWVDHQWQSSVWPPDKTAATTSGARGSFGEVHSRFQCSSFTQRARHGTTGCCMWPRLRLLSAFVFVFLSLSQHGFFVQLCHCLISSISSAVFVRRHCPSSVSLDTYSTLVSSSFVFVCLSHSCGRDVCGTSLHNFFTQIHTCTAQCLVANCQRATLWWPHKKMILALRMQYHQTTLRVILKNIGIKLHVDSRTNYQEFTIFFIFYFVFGYDSG